MNKIIIAFFLLLVLIQGSIKTAMVAYYRINKDYIAANFCENRSNKLMHCEGKCFLNKKMKAQDEQEKRTPSVLKGLEEIILYCSSFDFSFSFSPLPHRLLKNTFYLLKQYNSPAFTIFQPPQ